MTEALEAKIDAVGSIMEARFSHADMERAGLVSWMERVSGAVDRLVALSSNILLIQQRTQTVEASVADMALDIDGLDTRMSDIESNRKADVKTSKLLISGLSATGGALAIYLFDKLIGKS